MKDQVQYNKLCDIGAYYDWGSYAEHVAKPSAEHLAHYVCNHLEPKLADLIELEMLGGRKPPSPQDKVRLDINLDIDVQARTVEWDWVHDTYGAVKQV